MAPVNFVNCSTVNCGSMISVPKGSTLSFNITGGSHINTDSVFHERDDPTAEDIISYLGIDKNINSSELAELIKKVQAAPDDQKQEQVEKSQFFQKFSSSIATGVNFGASIVTIASHPHIAAILKTLGG